MTRVYLILLLTRTRNYDGLYRLGIHIWRGAYQRIFLYRTDNIYTIVMTYTVELYCNGNVTDDIVRKINNKVADLYWKKSWLGIREWQMCNYDKTTSALTFTTLSFATITELADLLQSCIIDVLYSNRCILSGKICGMTESGDIHMVSIVDNIIRVYDKKTLIEIVDEIEAEL